MTNAENIFLFPFNSFLVEDDGTHCHLAITVWVNMSQCFHRGKIWMRACWDVMVRLSEVPLIHYRERTSALSAHWNKHLPFSRFFLNWNQGWAVSPLPSIAFTHSYQPLPDLEADHCPCLGKDQELHQGGWVSSLGVGQRKESLGGSKFRENHPKMSHLLYTLLCPCRRSSLKSDLLWKIPERSLNWECSSLRCKVELSSWLVVSKQSCLSLESSHPISSS